METKVNQMQVSAIETKGLSPEDIKKRNN